jgi:hypothetical protein
MAIRDLRSHALAASVIDVRGLDLPGAHLLAAANR